MSDIVERLRDYHHPNWPFYDLKAADTLMREAADEIERLREHINALLLVATSHEPEALRQQAEIERLREENKFLRSLVADELRALEPKP